MVDPWVSIDKNMKKNKHLILHIGTIKTGTSSIQESLGAARDVLLKHHIHYPAIQPYNHIFSFPPIFVDDPGKIDWFLRRLQPHEDRHAKIQGYSRDWLKEFKTCDRNDHFVISAEHLTAPFFVQGAVERLKEFVEPYFEQITVIAYVRHYDSWIASEVQQAVKNGFSKGEGVADMVRNMQHCPPLMSYRRSLQKWINVFGREAIVVRPFDPQSFYNHSLLADFFHASGLPADDISIPEIRVNESISSYAVAFLQKYNQTYPVFVDGAINPERALVRHGLPIHMYNKLAFEKFKLDLVYSPEQAQRLNVEIDYVNQFFENGYQFHRVSAAEGETQVPEASDIPVEFFVELINNYNRLIETQRKRIENQRGQNEMLREQKAYFQRFFDVLKIPFFLRILDRVPMLKRILKKIAQYTTR
jgi:hypothetical protein